MRKVVLIGADGMLGRCWEELLRARGIDHVATTIDDLDITDSGAVAQVITPGVKWVVNCAAYTLVDAAEENEALADELAGEVHALALHTYTPEEWQARFGDAPMSPPCLGGKASEGEAS